MTGPAVVTGPERAAIVSEVVRTPVTYVNVTVAQLRGGLVQAGLPERIVDAIETIEQHQRALTVDIDARRDRSTATAYTTA